MGLKSKQILLKCDFLGYIPEFRILNEARYKSIFSSILSILIIIFSIIFVCYSFEEFLNQIPKVEYYKNNDYSTNKSFVISDSLIMFQYLFSCDFDFKVMPDIKIIKRTKGENKEHLKEEYLTFEPCKLGKNINLKYKETIKKLEEIEEWNLDDYYCINFNSSNFTLFSHPSLASHYENSLQLIISSNCKDYYLRARLITENDIIDHSQKDNPIIPYYQKNDIALYNEEKHLVYNYQYIKYESNNGIFFNDKKISSGIGFSGSNLFDKDEESKNILSIQFKMNSFNYDFYKKTYVKFQSFLADVMSLINLIIAISKGITEFLLYKKMNKDIIKYIITDIDIKRNNKGKQVISKKLKLKNIFNIDDNKIHKVEKFGKKIEQNQINEEKINSKVNLDIQNNDYVLEIEKENDDKNVIKVMKKLNFINIIKSFLCFRDKKLKLINLCDNIVNRDICVERILRRLYVLENEYSLIKEGIKNKSFIDNDISKVKNIIKRINKEANKQIKNKYGHLSKENNVIKK